MTLDPIEIPFCWNGGDIALIAIIGLSIFAALISIVVIAWRAVADRGRGLYLLYRIGILHPPPVPPAEPKDLPPVTNGRYR